MAKPTRTRPLTPFGKSLFRRAMKAAKRGEFRGYCTACGASQLGVDPDARGYECETCGAEKVYGAEELVLMLY